MPKTKTLYVIGLLLLSNLSFAQMEYDSSVTMGRKNIIRYNPVPTGVLGIETFVLISFLLRVRYVRNKLDKIS